MSVKLHPGEELIAGYTLVRSLGRGGYGEVWEARAPGGVRVALKFIRLEGRASELEQRALETIRDIRHPHLLDVQFAVILDDFLVIAMPLCDRNLKERLEECRKAGLSGIPRDELIDYLRDVARAVDYLNEPRHPSADGRLVGVQHRDIKPHNIFLVGGSARLADFGLAKVLEHSSAEHTGGMSPHYVSPEAIQGRVSSRTDQYSLAVTYVQLRTGRLPFGPGSVHSILFAHVHAPPDLAGLSPEEVEVVRRALAKNPEDRWPDCRAFLRSLEACEATSPDHVPETRPPGESMSGFVLVEDLLSGDPTIPAIPPATPPPIERSGPREGTSGRVAHRVRAGAMALVIVVVAGVGLFGLGPTPAPVPRGAARSIPVAAEPEPTRANVPAPVAPRPMMTSTNTAGMRLVLIPAGKFLMGAPEGEPEAGADEKPQHRIRITRPFYLGSCEVTQAEYRQVMGTNPSWFAPEGEGKDDVAGMDTSRHPVEQISWDECVAFCNKLSVHEGLRPYYGQGGETFEGADGYRLPTEAEWEYACRAGTKTVFAFGDRISSDEVNFDGDFDYNGSSTGIDRERTMPAGSFRPNAFGLFDMHGNVSEWCQDGYGGAYQPLTRGEDPEGPSSPVRVVRGGGFKDIPRDCRSATRLRQVTGFRSNDVGFRVARTPAPHGDRPKPGRHEVARR